MSSSRIACCMFVMFEWAHSKLRPLSARFHFSSKQPLTAVSASWISLIPLMRVLLVEDNPTLAKSLTDALTQAHFTVDCMHDGEAADHVLRTQDYALVILDLGLPKLDGLEVLRRLRQRRNSVPVMILTAHGSVEDRVRGLD